MPAARIANGRWKRSIKRTWEKDGDWRTDMQKAVLSNPRVIEAEFDCEDGPLIIVPVEDLRRVLPLGPDHWRGQKWGPFWIDPNLSTTFECR